MNKVYTCDRNRECKNMYYCGTLCTTTSDPNHDINKKHTKANSLILLIKNFFNKKERLD